MRVPSAFPIVFGLTVLACANAGPRYDDPTEVPIAAVERSTPSVQEPPHPDVSSLTDAELASELDTAYAAKLTNPGYAARKDHPGIPTGAQEFPEEWRIKALRAEIARRVSTPDGIQPIRIPLVSDSAVRIDGRLDPGEWHRAVRITLTHGDEPTRLSMISDGRRLYLACDVPRDTTSAGYDQFRFYVHVDTSAAIRNERVHLSGRAGSGELRGIRQTTVRWLGAPPANEDQGWRKRPISDWGIYSKARGQSGMASHRQYEAVLDLAETGLHVGIPFPAFVQIETDPETRPDGKFAARVYAGFLGSQAAPGWFVIGDER